MSDTDQNEPQCPGWFDSESDLPRNSSVDSTIELWQRVSSLPSKPKLKPWISEIATSQAQPPIGALQWVTYHWKRQNPVKG